MSFVLAALLATVPLDGPGRLVRAADGCTLADEVRGTTCRGGGEGRLDGPGSTATYRVDVLGPGASISVVLVSENESLNATLLDWRGNAVGQTTLGPGAQNPAMPIAVPLPGVYALRVAGDVPAGGAAYMVGTTVSYPHPDGKPAVQPAWPPGMASADGPISGERQVIRVPRGGTPAAGVAASRILGTHDTFEEGQRHTLVDDAPLAVMPTS
jgi:hypothetical protein